MEGTLTGTYSTRPFSTILEILTPNREAESFEDGLMPPTEYHCSCESLTALRRSTAWFTQAQTSAITCEQDAVSTWLQGSKTALLVMLSQIAAYSANIRMPESEKNSHEILHAKQSITHLILAKHHARSRLMVNLSPEVTGPRTMGAVSWNTCIKQDDSPANQTIRRLHHIRHDTYFKQMLASTKTSLQRAKRQDVTYVRAAPRWKPLQLSLVLHKGLVLSPTSLNPTASDPPPFQTPIQ